MQLRGGAPGDPRPSGPPPSTLPSDPLSKTLKEDEELAEVIGPAGAENLRWFASKEETLVGGLEDGDKPSSLVQPSTLLEKHREREKTDDARHEDSAETRSMRKTAAAKHTSKSHASQSHASQSQATRSEDSEEGREARAAARAAKKAIQRKDSILGSALDSSEHSGSESSAGSWHSSDIAPDFARHDALSRTQPAGGFNLKRATSVWSIGLKKDGQGLLSTVRVPELAVAVLLFFGIYSGGHEWELDGVPIPAARKCLALTVCISALWATEAIPLHATALLVPLLTVMTKCLLPDHAAPCAAADARCWDQHVKPMEPNAAAREICAQFFDPTVLLFMAGFSIGSVLEKQGVASMVASHLLRPFGSKPENLLLGIMLLGTLMSMWICNVPSSVLCVSLAQPIINQLEPNDPFAKALLLGIAISNNIGGMTTPIASPQSVIAFGWCSKVGAKISFLSWMRFSLPICGLLLLVAWKLLIWSYPPLLAELETDRLHTASSFMALDSRQVVACVATVCTVVSWALWKQLRLEAVFGAMGVVGLIPIILFCSLGLIDRRGFHQELNWSVLILIGGGLALGHVMQRSFLLEIMSAAVETLFKGAGLWTFMMAFCVIMGVVGNFMSSTVAAIVILPVVANVGQTIGHSSALIVSTVLMNCCAMALPVSSFPNANSFAVTRKLRARGGGEEAAEPEDAAKAAAPILTVKDYLATGGVITLLALPIMGTLGYLSVSILE